MKKSLLISVVVAAVVAGIVSYALQGGGDVAQHRETAYERVVRTGELNCSYLVAEPYFTKDVNTGKLGGMMHEYTEAMGQLLGLKINWVREVPYGEVFLGLNSGQVDAHCGGLWKTPSRTRVGDYVMPIAYEPVFIYARAGDMRFDENPKLLDDPATKISIIDGEGASYVAKKDFPNATKIELPQMTDFAQLFLNVTNNKADVTINSPTAAYVFMKNNPNTLRQVKLEKPLRLYGVGIPVAKREHELRRMLEAATEELLSDGTLEKIISAHEPFPNSFYRPEEKYDD